MSGNTSKRYPPELKARAVRMYAVIRPDHQTDWAAMAGVAEFVGVSTGFLRRGRSGVVGGCKDLAMEVQRSGGLVHVLGVGIGREEG